MKMAVEKLKYQDLLDRLRSQGASLQKSRERYHRLLEKYPEIKTKNQKMLPIMNTRPNNQEESRLRSGWRAFTKRINDFELFKGLLRDQIQGRFGPTVYNFFKFIKWACMLNLVMVLFTFCVLAIPQFVVPNEPSIMPACSTNHNISIDGVTFYEAEFAETCCSALFTDQLRVGNVLIHGEDSTMENIRRFFTDLVQGTGWMSDTYFYYGKYTLDSNLEFRMDLAYWFIMLACLVLSLLWIVRSSAKSFEPVLELSKYNSLKYADLCFSSWSFCIKDEDAVKVKQIAMCNEMKTAINVDEEYKKSDQRTSWEKFKLFTIRLFFHLVVLGIQGAFFFGLFNLYNFVPDEMNRLKCPSSDYVFSGSAEISSQVVYCTFLEYSTSFSITAASILLPIIFTKFIQYEKYNPNTTLIINISRSIFLRIVSLILTIISKYYTVNCGYTCYDGTETLECTTTTTTNDTGLLYSSCSNFNVEGAACDRGICWENTVGQEFFKLTLLDLAVFLARTFVNAARGKVCCHFGCDINFDVTNSVLDIVYSQTICWMGLFFAPMLSLVTFLKFTLIFFVNIIYVKTVCKPDQTSFFQASRISSIFKGFLLVGFIVSIVPIGLFIWNVEPSNSCGPFKGQPNYYNVVILLIEDWSWKTGKDLLYLLGEMTTLYIIFAGLLMYNFSLWAQVVAQDSVLARLQQDINQTNKAKKLLLEERKKRESQMMSVF